MKELLVIVTISLMEAIGFIGFTAGLLGIDLSDMGIGRLILLVTGVTLMVFISICIYLCIKQVRKRECDIKTERSYKQIDITTYPVDKCRKSAKNGMCA
ncbi:hypothetical protein [Agathobacter sp.]